MNLYQNFLGIAVFFLARTVPVIDAATIRNKLVALLADIRLQNGNADVLSDTHKALMNELHVVYDEAPATTDSAVKKASEALIDKQDYTFSDEEIDRFLPAQLRKEVTE